MALLRRWPTTPIARGQIVLLTLLVVLTVGAWALTVHQARTMDMSMGILASGGGEGAASSSGPTVFFFIYGMAT